MERLIQNCMIIDGSGEPAFSGSVGIDRGKLTVYREGPLPHAETVTDGTGLTVMPGFIDAHSHGDLTMQSRYALVSKLNQGITSQIAGQCGVSMFPADPERGEDFRKFVKGLAPHPDLPEDGNGFRDAEAFLSWAAGGPVGTRSFVGHGALRLFVMGYENRKPDAAELERMKQVLRACIRQGAMGLSCGLVYPPSCYAENDEILALLRVCREEGGMFACHPRNEADTCIEARAESIRLAMEAGVPLSFSHLKAAGRDNWGKPARMLEMAEEMLDRGGRILIDTYPYTAGATSLDVSIPPEYFTHGRAGMVRALQDPKERERIRSVILTKTPYENYVYNCGGWEGVLIGSCDRMHDGEGLTVAEYARRLGLDDPFDAYVKVLVENGGSALGTYFHMSPEDVERILLHPACVVGTDGLIGAPDGNPHPRAFGTMPHAIRMMTSGPHAVKIEEAVRKMTGQTADFFRLSRKGYIRTGMDADLLLTDLNRLSDTADYRNGNGLCTGILEVISGGRTVFREGEGF